MKNITTNTISVSSFAIGVVFAFAATLFLAAPAHAQYDSYSYDASGGYDSYSYDTGNSGYDSYSYDTPSYDSYSYDNGSNYGYANNYDSYSYDTPAYNSSYDGYSYDNYSAYSASYDYGYDNYSVYPDTSYDYGYSNYSSGCNSGCGGSGYVSGHVYTPAPVYTYHQPVVYNNPQPVYVPAPSPVVQNTVYYPTYTPTYTYNTTQYYPALVVACSVNTTFAPIGTSVTWTAYVSGGSGSYTYSWSGTDGLYGYAQFVYRSYNDVGLKYGSVTVHSDGQTVTQSCSNNLTVGVRNPVYIVPRVLDIGCFVDPTNLVIGQPVTWTAEVTGGSAPYTYSWTGSDGLVGNQRTVIKSYGTSGNKSAIVTITSADGRTGTKACSNAAKVKVPSSGNKVVKSTSNTTVTKADTSSLAASPVFAFPNIPWCWIAVFIIIILFITVVYLLFNKNKI